MPPVDTPRNDDHGPLEVGPTCFNKLITGDGSFTSTDAVDVFPVPPFVEFTVTELFLRPAVEPVTLTVTAQDAPAARLPPFKLKLEELSTAAAVPPQEFDRLLGVAMIRPKGKESVKLTPLRIVELFGLLIVKLNVVVLPLKIGFAVKDLAITGGSMTVSVAVPIPVDAVFGPVSVEETLLLTFV